jgi:3,4-dihydroxy 2-butanone 4-phosphate synthase / GTP cyclohydrolase II
VSGAFESSLVVAADNVTARAIAFVVRHSSSFLCATVTPDRADTLELPP